MAGLVCARAMTPRPNCDRRPGMRPHAGSLLLWANGASGACQAFALAQISTWSSPAANTERSRGRAAKPASRNTSAGAWHLKQPPQSPMPAGSGAPPLSECGTGSTPTNPGAGRAWRVPAHPTLSEQRRGYCSSRGISARPPCRATNAAPAHCHPLCSAPRPDLGPRHTMDRYQRVPVPREAEEHAENEVRPRRSRGRRRWRRRRSRCLVPQLAAAPCADNAELDSMPLRCSHKRSTAADGCLSSCRPPRLLCRCASPARARAAATSATAPGALFIVHSPSHFARRFLLGSGHMCSTGPCHHRRGSCPRLP